MRGAPDHYAMLGLAPTASSAEIRRAFRRLALQFHPDRAGADSTPIFQRIADAYAVLGHDETRAAYDAVYGVKPGGTAFEAGAERVFSPVQGDEALRARLRADGQLLTRLSRPLLDLIARDQAFQHPDGRIDLFLSPAEGERGGVALISLPLSVLCPTCGGISRPGGFWCLRCHQTGRIADDVTIYCAVRPKAEDGTVVTIAAADFRGTEAIHVRVCVRQ